MWAGSAPSAVSATNGCDPCKAIGAGWRLSTTAEWVTAVSSEGIVLPANTNAYTSNLKLTASGNRNTSGTYDFVSTRGYYWSSTPSSTGGKYHYFSAAANTPCAGGLWGQGMSIRCLKGAIISVDSLRVGVLNNHPAAVGTNGDTLALTATVYPAAISQSVIWSIIPVLAWQGFQRPAQLQQQLMVLCGPELFLRLIQPREILYSLLSLIRLFQQLGS